LPGGKVAVAQGLVADLSEHLIAITTSFEDTYVVLFGISDGGRGIVVTVVGPRENQVVSRKVQLAGIWVNRDSLEFVRVPGYYAVASSAPLDEIARPERLCCGSRVLPWGLGFEDGVEDGEEFAHASGDGDFGGAAAGDEAGVEGTDGGVAADGGEGWHVQGRADAGASTQDHTSSAEGTTVAVDRGDADEARDLASIEGAELGQLGDQGAGGGFADARDRGQQILGGAPGRARAHGVVEIGLDLAELLLQPGQMRPDPTDQLGLP
jgi:hypothetical protein